MRRALLWYVPVGVALLSGAVFAAGFYWFVRGDIGENVVATPAVIERQRSAAPRGEIIPLILGDSLARGTGDQTGLGIGGRLVDELKKSRPGVKRAVNIAVNGSRTPDLLTQLQSHNVQTL